MIIAIGYDLVEIKRIRRLIQRQKAVQRLFTEHEVEYCQRYNDSAPSFAVRFAAKEAFQKVWPRPHGWRDVWVWRPATPQGPFPYARPTLRFSQDIADEMQEQTLRAHLSLSHTHQYAGATVVLEQIQRLEQVPDINK